MNIESTKINQTKHETITKTSNFTKDSETKFSEELNILAESQNETQDVDNEESSSEQKNEETDEKYNSAIDNLNEIVQELNQSDEKNSKNLKDSLNTDDKGIMINKDYNIQDKELMPQMNPNMNFGSDGQPFSSFMNNQTENQASSSNAQELAEEAAIMSTMAENMAIANKNNLINKNIFANDNKNQNYALNNSVKTTNIQDKKTIEINNESGIRKIDTRTNATIETVVKFDSIVMNQADVEIFAELVQKGEANINNLAPEAANRSIHISKTLADLLAKSMENNQPLRIDFDNNISVIIKISRDGKISADFLPSTQIAEAYLKENLPLLRQRFDDNNINYENLSQKDRKEQQREKQQRERSQK